jgi:glycosyltransferase involved in cell wall biosynthesis
MTAEPSPTDILVVSTTDRGEKITRPLSAVGVPTTSFRIQSASEVPALVDRIRTDRPSVVVVDSLSFAGFAVALCRLLFSIPYVVRIRGDAMAEHRSSFRRHLSAGSYARALKQIPRFFATKTALEATDNYLFVSEYLQQVYGADGEGSAVINTPCFMLDDDPKDPERTPSFDLPPENTVLLAVTNMMYPRKVRGLLQALDPISEVLSENPDTTLLVAGDGPYRDSVERRSEHLSGDIRVLGYVPGVRELFERADIFVHFSLLDGYPSTVLEAYASQTPVVANDAVGMSEQVVDGETGRLVDLDQPDTVRRCLSELLHAPEERARLGAGGYERVRSNNTSETIGRQFRRYLSGFLDE